MPMASAKTNEAARYCSLTKSPPSNDDGRNYSAIRRRGLRASRGGVAHKQGAQRLMQLLLLAVEPDLLAARLRRFDERAAEHLEVEQHRPRAARRADVLRPV